MSIHPRIVCDGAEKGSVVQGNTEKGGGKVGGRGEAYDATVLKGRKTGSRTQIHDHCVGRASRGSSE